MSKGLKPKNPFNIELLYLTKQQLSQLGEVKSKDIYEQNSTTFKKDGLFSTEIFGDVGSIERMERFGYIKTGFEIIHPLIYRHLNKIKTLYTDIIKGTKYAIFDENVKDFVPATTEEGQTGFKFFLKYYNQIEYPKGSGSEQRLERIKFLKSYDSDKIVYDFWLVIPAGMRDYIVTESGKKMEDAINAIYRKLLTISSVANKFKGYGIEDSPYAISVRNKLQEIVNDIYNYIENILDGKEGFIQGKWVKRRLLYGTRNVLTSLPIEVDDFKKPNKPGFNHTVVGLYQFLKAILPKAIHNVRTKFLDNIFSIESYNAYLINKDTLQRELVTLTEKVRSQWITDEGIENTINKLIQDVIKKSPIIINDHYLYLVYDDGKEIIVLNSINDLPPDKDKKYVRPITYAELFYLAVWDLVDKTYGFTTRYPITGYGSVYPCKTYLKVSLRGREVIYKGVGTTQPVKLYEYPNFKTAFFTSMAVHPTHLSKLGADMDGDKLNYNAVWEDESTEELEKTLNSVSYYVDMSGKLNFSASDDISELCMTIFTE